MSTDDLRNPGRDGKEVAVGIRTPVVIVTGAASGIGKAVANQFSASGWNVVACDRDGERLERVARKESVAAVVMDVTSEEDNATAVRVACDRFGGVDAVVLNAGINRAGPIEQLSLEAFDTVMNVNVRGVVLGIRAALPELRRSGGGSIVVTASLNALGGDAGMWAYSASKSAVLGIVKSLARDHAWEGIRVNAVCPGPVATNIEGPPIPGLQDQLVAAIPVGRIARAAEIATVIEFLASPASAYINGVALPVDGGVSAGTGVFLPPHSLGEIPGHVNPTSQGRDAGNGHAGIA